jgi:uncharacterized iron-regulated protein
MIVFRSGIVRETVAALLIGLALLGGCASQGPIQHPRGADAGAARHTEQVDSKVLDLHHLTDLDAIMPALARQRVVCVGELHDRYSHHLNQLEIIRRLHQVHPDLVIGMEYFQTPFQPYLDAYVAGDLDERAFLDKTEYYQRWKFDYRLYRPILDYAREHRIPLIALNIPREITEKVSRSGISGLTQAEAAMIPQELDRSDARYRQRIKEIFAQHPNGDHKGFEHFFEAQLLWDEGMADTAARYLKEHPQAHMVILAGSGHLIYGSGIPLRLARRLGTTHIPVVLNGINATLERDMADYILLSRPVELPPPGRLGIYMKDAEGGGAAVSAFSKDSAAQAEGMEQGDRILAIDGARIRAAADVRLALLDKSPGESVRLEVQRATQAGGAHALEFEVNLR